MTPSSTARGRWQDEESVPAGPVLHKHVIEDSRFTARPDNTQLASFSLRAAVDNRYSPFHLFPGPDKPTSTTTRRPMPEDVRLLPSRICPRCGTIAPAQTKDGLCPTCQSCGQPGAPLPSAASDQPTVARRTTSELDGTATVDYAGRPAVRA